MSTYKIINITNQLGKRNANFNSVLKIDYVDGMEVKSLFVKPNETTYLTVSSLPLSLHRMRIKSWVTVDEISKKELKKLIANEKRKQKKVTKPVKINKPVKKVKIDEPVKTVKTTRKKKNQSQKTDS